MRKITTYILRLTFVISMISGQCLILNAQNDKVAYLFTYFTGNAPEQEQICYALSDDGYNWTPLNNGRPVIASDTIAFTGCVRDPHILRCEDGKTFYMVATDMKSNLGWSSNRGMVLMKSTDLIHWEHTVIHFPTKFANTWRNVQRVWAPETVYDTHSGKYVVFYSLLSPTNRYDKIYYSYANAEFTDITEPQLLFDDGKAAIDGDIVYNKADGVFHLFYKSEAGGGIFQATTRAILPEAGQKPGEQWTKIPSRVEVSRTAVEGVGVCQAIDGKSWIVMYDCYSAGHYQFCTSQDLKTFKFVQDTKTQGVFTPRHGTMIPITQAEKNRLLSAFGSTKQPILEGFHADPEVLYSNKTKKYYIYSTTDGFDGWGGYYFQVFSSTNLIDWTNEGTMLDVKSDQVPWARGNAWAPAIEEVKQKDGTYKYYFYYSADAGRRKEIGVAIADDPCGPFVDFGKPIISESPAGHGQQIDVDVFTDPKTGKHYIYWGNGYMAGAELNDDMTSIKQNTITVLTPDGGTLRDYAYREGTYVFYRNGTYYFMWSVDDTGSPNYHVAYGTSKKPLGPITVAEEPIVLKQDPSKQIYGPAHNSVLQIKGKDQWYIVYHRINRDFLNNGPGIHREVCIDEMKFDKKGKIIPVQPTLNGPAPLK